MAEPPEQRKDDQAAERAQILAIIGAVYARDSVSAYLGLTKPQLDQAELENRVLAVHTREGDAAYPVFQFGSHGELLPHMSEAIAILRDRGFGEMTIAALLFRREAVWEGETAADLLRVDTLAAEVLQQLREDFRRPLADGILNDSRLALARPILDRFVALVTDLPVIVAKDTLFVTRETKTSIVVFAMSLRDTPGGLEPMHFELNEGMVAADRLADEVRNMWR